MHIIYTLLPVQAYVPNIQVLDSQIRKRLASHVKCKMVWNYAIEGRKKYVLNAHGLRFSFCLLCSEWEKVVYNFTLKIETRYYLSSLLWRFKMKILFA